jgi:IclR family transcriptional regulator, acetate operon repressor
VDSHGKLNISDNPDTTAVSASSDKPGVAGTAAFAKFMTVLQVVADASSSPAMADLVRLSGYPRPTVYRIVAALVEQGMLAEAPVAAGVPGRYRLGPRLIQLASRAWSQLDLRSVLADDLRALRD